MERDVLEGTYLFNMHSNPQKATDTDGNSAEVKPSANELNKNSALSGLEERIENLKTHLNLTFKDYPSKLSIHQKVSALEERIMQLERDYPVWSALHFVQSGEKLPNPSSYTIVASKDPKSNSVQLKKTKLTPSLNNPLPAKNTSTIAQDMYSNYESNTNSNLKASSLVISEPDILIPNSPKKRKRGRPRLTDYVNINTTPSTSFSFMKPRSKVKIDNKRKKRKYTKREKAVDVNELVNNNTGDAISSSKMDKLIKEQVELLNKNRAQSTSQSQAQFAGKVYWPFSNSKRTSSLTKAVLTKFLSKQQQEISKFTINNDANAGLNMPTGRNVASSSHHMVDGNTAIDSTDKKDTFLNKTNKKYIKMFGKLIGKSVTASLNYGAKTRLVSTRQIGRRYLLTPSYSNKESMERGRQQYRMKNAALFAGLSLTAIGIYYYSMYAVGQEDFSDIPLPEPVKEEKA
ncbi:hypothetical protein AX774_g1785 [Zancudomyces culisetae]|uniref:Cytochrome c oxidase assembly factor 3 n=1 Tax=Zancudomyces culisetae TaxID=1213189 RepID=A0A1R1PUT3_ZANCU|nr:hypothetical protein AX774_g1785 [Zancudomyces culisetae]|eukprot:OMH84687.1 hypothetical protein AX774_g1785 [Zancudomyces culisetae]